MAQVEVKPITFVITANLEDEIHLLLNSLVPQLFKDIDRIIILMDDTPDNSKTKEYRSQIRNTFNELQFESYVLLHHELKGDFANHRNFINGLSYLKDRFLICLDADETVEPTFRKLHHQLFRVQPDVEVIYYPRINTVEGITDEHLKKWSWSLNQYGWINYPDYQGRGYVNNGKIQWVNKVHEKLDGYKTYYHFNHAKLIHKKTISKQEQQNGFYEKL